MNRSFYLVLLAVALLFAGCATLNYADSSDAARRRQIQGRWYDQWIQGMSFANGTTTYHPDGTFTAAYESVAPGTSAEMPAIRESTEWSGKWHVEGGQLIEDILKTNAPERTPADRPLIRIIASINANRMTLMNATGRASTYARKQPKPPKVTFTPGS